MKQIDVFQLIGKTDKGSFFSGIRNFGVLFKSNSYFSAAVRDLFGYKIDVLNIL